VACRPRGSLFVEHDARIGIGGAGELVVQARGERGPLAAERVPDDTDPLGIDLRQRGQGVVAVGRNVGQAGEGLNGRTLLSRVASRPADREADKAAPGELVAEVAHQGRPVVARIVGELRRGLEERGDLLPYLLSKKKLQPAAGLR